jgi:hypothetical protein
MLPYVSLPTKLHSAVLAPMQVAAGETSEAFAHRIHEAMQNRLDQLVAHRRPVLG